MSPHNPDDLYGDDGSFDDLAKTLSLKYKASKKFYQSKFASPEFEEGAQGFLAQKVILSEIERVLVLPIEDKKGCLHFELIFGYGNSLENDLFVLFERKEKKGDEKERPIYCLPFKIDNSKREEWSPAKQFKKLGMYDPKKKEKGIPPWDSAGKPRVYSSHIEEIKETLKAGIKLWGKDPFEVRAVKNFGDLNVLDLEQLRKSPSLKYVPIILERFKNAAFVLLRDVFEPGYGLQPYKRVLKYDPYPVVREFLKDIGVYAERRGGLSASRETASYNDVKNVKEKIAEMWKEARTDFIKQEMEGVKKLFEVEGSKKNPSNSKIKQIIEESFRKHLRKM